MMPVNERFKYAVRDLPKAKTMRQRGHTKWHEAVIPFGSFHDPMAELSTITFTLSWERLPDGTEVGVWRFNDIIVRVDV